ncbi:hypothetical protein GN244_ATG09638 [Phytophthora infestans]|uniref:Uncharacterized protein n=1 Tax=Phytophthora infestans TaxID=4787 RepID=A0A833SR37_PHYIN|nr:hypothetical protein GN244_ATG09638 [Phytophthora infestans]
MDHHHFLSERYAVTLLLLGNVLELFVQAQEDRDDVHVALETQQMNMLIANNDAMRMPMETDPSAVFLTSVACSAAL